MQLSNILYNLLSVGSTGRHLLCKRCIHCLNIPFWLWWCYCTKKQKLCKVRWNQWLFVLMTSLGFWMDMWDVWELDLLRQAAIAKRLLCGGIILDWFYYMDPCFSVALQPCIYSIATPRNKPQTLQWVYKASGLALPKFILTCPKLHFHLLKQIFFSHREVTCTTSFYLPQFPMVIAVQHLEPLNLKAWTGTMKTSPL